MTGVFDLGSLITDLGTTYIESRWGDRAGGAPSAATSLLGGITQGLVDMPGIEVVSQPPVANGKGMIYDPAANCGNGKWIQKRRRRRRSIMTNAEAAQLLKATSVLKGKQLEIWLAKRA